MNKTEAKQIILEVLEAFETKPFDDLVAMIDAEPYTQEITEESGLLYQIEVMAIWDDKPGGTVRVMGMIDDGGIRAFAPLSDGFLVEPPSESQERRGPSREESKGATGKPDGQEGHQDFGGQRGTLLACLLLALLLLGYLTPVSSCR